MPDSSLPTRAVRPGKEKYTTLQPDNGPCFIYIQLYDDENDEVMPNTEYTLRGLNHGTTLSGTTDEEGILRHEFLLDDDYELDCSGKTEVVETYYMDEPDHEGIDPWGIWMWREGS